jgi:superfamily II DNA or RNA helicase
MPSDVFPLVDMGDIIKLVGKASFDRAQAYARNGAVMALEWDAEEGVLHGTVKGSERRPYHCEIELRPTHSTYSKPVDSTCTCPMDWDCKHVAATLLSSNAAHLKHAAGVGPATTKAAQVPEWKRVAGVVTEPGVTTVTRRIPGFANLVTFTPTILKPPVAMSLQFELRAEAPRTEERWRGPQLRAAGATAASSGPVRLGVRPVTLGVSGKWVRAGLTWNNLIYGVNRLNLDPVQHRWFCQFAALHRATPQVYAGQDSDWYYLDDFNSALLWPLLEEAKRLGIGLVGSKKDTTVVIGTHAEVSLDASTGAAGGPAGAAGGLRLTTTLTIDGTAHPSDRAGAIADHGVYSFELTPPSTITLAPTTHMLSAEQRRLLGRPPQVLVPAPDLPEFFADFYPALRKIVPLTSMDASVDFPQIAPPELVLTATFLPKHTVRLNWDWEYHDTPTPSRKPLHASSDDQLSRDETVEREVLSRATSLLRAELVQPALTLQGITAAEFTEKQLPVLDAADGIRVDIVGDKPDYRELTAAPKLTVTTVETDQRDWFDLGVIVTIEGKQVPFGPLFTALSKGWTKLLLVDNSYLSLQHPAFDQLRELINEAQSLAEWETGLRISRYQAGLWADFEELADETEQAQSWRAAVGGLNELATLEAVSEPTPLPAGLSATLRPYQRDGFNWLAFLWRHGLGGILADDMGLGKTLQALALILHATEQDPTRGAPGAELVAARRPFLVVAPTSVVSNWLTEAARFAPGLRVVGIAATEAKSGTQLADAALGADLVVTSYALFRLDFDSYQAHGWAGLILDEAQFVKNRTARVHTAARDLNTPFKLAITGTPMENNLLELHSLFAIVAPGLFPSARRFTEVYQRPIEGGDKGVRNTGEAAKTSTLSAAQLLTKLRRRIRPLMMRRTKELVASDLPAKQEQVLRIDLEPRHRKLYDTFLQRERQKLLGLIDDMDKNRFIIFRSLTLLRMLSLDASLVDEKYAHVPSSKLDALFEQLDDVVAEGHRALIFSQFTSFLKKAAARLDDQGIPYCYLDGSTLRRSQVIDRFKSGQAPVFLISLKAGGFGLNLTEADYVFLLDPWWNPATEAQAVDRTHRIGQTKNVMVYRMIANGTIEEKVMALKDKKAKLFNSVMDDDAMFSSALTADDIRGLLED